MEINEKQVSRPLNAAKLEIHFEGRNLICCKNERETYLGTSRGMAADAVVVAIAGGLLAGV